VCPTDCLKLVPISAVAGDEMVAAVIENRVAKWPVASAMLLDPTHCIRCGLCAARCPTEAVKMETFRFIEEVLFEKGDAL
jgi:ferredoxin